MGNFFGKIARKYSLSRSTTRNSSSGRSSTYRNGSNTVRDEIIPPLPATNQNIEESFHGEILPTPKLKIFTLAELKSATRNFRPDTILGEGGFGMVYKGWLDERTLSPVKSGTGIMVAVKKMKRERMQGQQEWQSEVEFLGRLSHPNFVKLLGYCYEDTEFLLVYEFLTRGSLDNHLFNRSRAHVPLSWMCRLNIAIGVARGLNFLHSSDVQIIYRDLKTPNILLDSDYNPKLSDFGLAKKGPAADNSHISTSVMGTYGYAAPEYISSGHLSFSSDVYGFGVVLLEIFSGEKAHDINRPGEKHNFVEWAKPYLGSRRKLKHIIDQRLEGQYSSEAATQVSALVRDCLASNHRTRPAIREVVEALLQIRTMCNDVARSSAATPRERRRRDQTPPHC